MSARDIIRRPIVTEKTNGVSANNWVVFEVAKTANKLSVAQAVREIYGIRPVAVNIVNTKPKTRRVGRYSGKTRAIKKAYVKLPEGQSIDIYNSEN